MNYYFMPYTKNDLGAAYNSYCELVPNDDDWITLVDGDVMMMYDDWGEKWENIINSSGADLVCAMTNRAHQSNNDQLVAEAYHNSNILYHKNIALQLYEKHGLLTKKISQDFISGFFFSFKKQLWKELGGFIGGLLHVDKDFYQRASKNHLCVVAKGFYVLHYYRMREDLFHGQYNRHLLN